MDSNVIFKVNLINGKYCLLVKILANILRIIHGKETKSKSFYIIEILLGFVFSEFHSGFFSTLRRSFGTKRVLANTVYCEYIKERQHVHMNATRWVALAGYVRWLGSQGIEEKLYSINPNRILLNRSL